MRICRSSQAGGHEEPKAHSPEPTTTVAPDEGPVARDRLVAGKGHCGTRSRGDRRAWLCRDPRDQLRTLAKRSPRLRARNSRALSRALRARGSKRRRLHSPGEHQVPIRTTNRWSDSNGEGRRRTKVIPRFPTERSCLSLLGATLITASAKWRGGPMTPAILRKLDKLRAVTNHENDGGGCLSGETDASKLLQENFYLISSLGRNS
jgi:hypothetical protein